MTQRFLFKFAFCLKFNLIIGRSVKLGKEMRHNEKSNFQTFNILPLRKGVGWRNNKFE